MAGCPECERMRQQLDACKRKLGLQAEEWERLTGELDGYKQAEARRQQAYSDLGRKRVNARWAKKRIS